MCNNCGTRVASVMSELIMEAHFLCAACCFPDICTVGFFCSALAADFQKNFSLVRRYFRERRQVLASTFQSTSSNLTVTFGRRLQRSTLPTMEELENAAVSGVPPPPPISLCILLVVNLMTWDGLHTCYKIQVLLCVVLVLQKCVKRAWCMAELLRRH